jgi:hypothetical protein
VVDNITIDGTEIDLSSGDLTLDVAGDIILDADDGIVAFRDGGVGHLQISNSSNDAVLTSLQNDKDLIIQGNDNGNIIEAARFDMSNAGSLLIGKTVQNNTAAGTVIQTDGFASFVRDGNFSLILNRLTDNGTIVDFRKDNTTVGSIGSVSGTDIELNSTLSGSLSAGGTKRFGWNTSGVFFPHTDNANDLGASGSRFNNLYLSGGIFVGGTGPGNKLEDYEEGTFTPQISGSGGAPTITHSIELGTYVKVGNLVQVTVSVGASGTPSGGSGDFIITGLPFTTKSGFQQAGSAAFTNILTPTSGTTQMGCNVEGGVTYINVNEHEYSGTSSMNRVQVSALYNSNPRIVCSIAYETA